MQHAKAGSLSSTTVIAHQKKTYLAKPKGRQQLLVKDVGWPSLTTNINPLP